MFTEILCNNLAAPANGQVVHGGTTGGKTPFGQKATFTCNQGYILQGAATLTCGGDSVVGKFGGQLPTCARMLYLVHCFCLVHVKYIIGQVTNFPHKDCNCCMDAIRENPHSRYNYARCMAVQKKLFRLLKRFFSQTIKTLRRGHGYFAVCRDDQCKTYPL